MRITLDGVTAEVNDEILATMIKAAVQDYIDDNDLIPSASDIADELDMGDIANNIDISDIASYVDVSAIIQEIAENFGARDIARFISCSDVADEISLDLLADVFREREETNGTTGRRARTNTNMGDDVYERLEKIEAFIDSIGGSIDTYRKKK